MRNTVLAVITLVIVLLSANATAAGGEATQALAEQAAVQRELARANAPVRNPAEFKRYLADHRGPSSPFHALSRGA